MRRLVELAWWGAGAVAAYPLAVLFLARLTGLSAPAAPISASFAVALAAALFLLPGRLAPQRAKRPRERLVATLAWIVAGQSLWLGFHFFRADLGSLGRGMVALTMAAQALWGALRILGGLFGALVRRLVWALPVVVSIPAFLVAWLAVAVADGSRRLFYATALLACLALLAIALPAIPIGPAPLAPYAPLALFLLAQAAAFYAFPVRGGFLTANPVGYTLMTVAWTAAAQLAWLAALFALDALDPVPRLLALGNGALQLFLALVLPFAIQFWRGRLALEDFIYIPGYKARPGCGTEFFRGSMAGRRTAWIVHYIGVSDDPRTLRQARALAGHGWRVVVCGFDGHSPRPAEWTYIRLPPSDPFRRQAAGLLTALGKLGLRLSAAGRPRSLRLAAARLHHWSNPLWLHIRRCLMREARRHSELKPDLVIAHNYFVGDIGYRLARLFGAKFVVDCHEYAAGEYSHDPEWTKTTRPYVVAVEDYYLQRADLVTTVCEGIAGLLNEEHALQRPAVVVRGVAFNNPQPYREPGERITVLYHGGIWPERQLHVALESMPLWREEFDLVLRGDGDPAYIAELNRLAAEKGLAHRVSIVPAVPFDEIVPQANKADIGYFSYANFSPQSEFALPNKFFEYVMAGLALCVLDLTEMGRLVRRYEFGKLIPEHTPEAIAATINSFTRAEIARCKRASLRAAQELNWDREQERLLAAYEAILGTARGPVAVPERVAAVSAVAGR